MSKKKKKNRNGRTPRVIKWLTRLVVLGVIVTAGGWLAMQQVDRAGWKFFNTGRDVVHGLAAMADALAARDFAALEDAYSERYAGSQLGLTDHRLAGERDGVHVYRFQAGAPVTGRGAAVAEWRQYLDGLESIDEVRMFVHRLHEWKDEPVATVRYELIGTPTGAARPAIDRAYFRMRFERTSEGSGGERTGEGMRLLEAALTTEPPDANHEYGGDRLASDTPHFVDVAGEAGVGFENRWYPAFLDENRDEPLKFGMLRYGPAGVTAADYDNDGFYDLFIPDGVESKLFRNQGDGTFADVTAEAGLAGLDGVAVGLFADYDNDGYKDFFVSRTFRPNQLFHNDGGGADGRVTFTDVTAAAGIGEDCCTTVASWADYDGDGDLDLYVGRYLDPRLAIPTTFYARNGEPNQLYRNDGDGTFTNVTAEAGVGEVGLCLGTVFGDYDDDGDADLYVVNDFGRKTLYRNEGDGTFRDVTVESGTLAYGAGMSASFGDYDNDGKLDVYVAHIRSEGGWFAETPTVFRYMANTWRQGVWRTDMPLYMEILRQSGTDFVQVFQDMASGNTLLRNRGDGTFEDVTWAARANPPGWFWGSGFYDFDNDGWQDIYAANGWVYNEPGTEIELEFLNNVVSEMQTYKSGAFFDPDNFGTDSWHGWERNRHLRNEGDGTFKEIGTPAGSDLITNSRGIAVADFWNRGALDMAVAASTDRHVLLRNDVGVARNWLQVEVVGSGTPEGTNRDGVGARVTIHTPRGLQVREVVLGDGYGSQNALRLHFGLGELAAVDELIVRWPRTGREQLFTDVAANRIVEVVEGRDELVEKRYERPAPAGP
jgi:hypothetical protein